MPPPLLIDLDQVDLSEIRLDRHRIYEHLPHRFEFQLLDAVCFLDAESKTVVAYREVREDDWYFRGHIPGRPVLPGVLMLEMAAQVSALAARMSGFYEGFVGFGGVDQCKFREPVTPPTRLYLLCVGEELRSRRIISRNQGVAKNKLIFEAKITGIRMP